MPALSRAISPMKKRGIRALITGAGSGSSGNLIRALRAVTPKVDIVGLNSDRFALKMSLADRNYSCPAPESGEFVNSILQIVRRERINVILPTDDSVVKALSDKRNRIPVELLLPRQATIDLCQDKHALNVFLRQRDISAPLTYEVRSLKSSTEFLRASRGLAFSGVEFAVVPGRWRQLLSPLRSRPELGLHSGGICAGSTSPISPSGSICRDGTSWFRAYGAVVNCCARRRSRY